MSRNRMKPIAHHIWNMLLRGRGQNYQEINTIKRCQMLKSIWRKGYICNGFTLWTILSNTLTYWIYLLNGNSWNHSYYHPRPVGFQPPGLGLEDWRVDIWLPRRGLFYLVGLPHLDYRHRDRFNGCFVVPHLKLAVVEYDNRRNAAEKCWSTKDGLRTATSVAGNHLSQAFFSL